MVTVEPGIPVKQAPESSIDAAAPLHSDSRDVTCRNPEISAMQQQSEEQKPSKKKRVRSVVFECLFYAVLIAVIVMVYSATSGSGTAPRSVFGYTFSTVLTGSMQSELPQGSLIVTRHVDPNTLKVDDNITFMQKDGTTVTHKIVGIHENYEQSGIRAFVTMGIENGMADDGVVWADNVVGKVIWHNLFLGEAFSYVKTNLLFVGAMAVLAIGFIVALRVFIASGKKKPGSNEAKEQCKKRQEG